jgi:hypothetical protein
LSCRLCASFYFNKISVDYDEEVGKDGVEGVIIDVDIGLGFDRGAGLL